MVLFYPYWFSPCIYNILYNFYCTRKYRYVIFLIHIYFNIIVLMKNIIIPIVFIISEIINNIGS